MTAKQYQHAMRGLQAFADRVERHENLAANYNSLRSRAVEMERAQQWRPIAEAPRDGTRILGTWANTWADDAPHIEAIECGELGIWFYSFDGDGPPHHNPPTHFRPLPPAP